MRRTLGSLVILVAVSACGADPTPPVKRPVDPTLAGEPTGGPTSPTGPTGPSSPTGPTGPSSPDPRDPTGPTGPSGPSGPSGPRSSGPTGPSGPSGPSSPHPSGPSGPSSPSGPTGPSSPSGPPAGWDCAEAWYGDADCDCGCGAADPVCAGSGCTTPGCTATACDYCVSADGELTTCETGPTGPTGPTSPSGPTGPTGPSVPSGWSCRPDYYGDGDCDCGCGVADSDCAGSTSCTTPGPCAATACDYCFDASGNGISCAAPVWTCPADWRGDEICDCGCGDFDDDCGSSPSCSAPGTCSALACDTCSDVGGGLIDCTGNWTCDPTWFADGICDCGCGAEDLDCWGATSCSEPGSCPNSACEACVGPNGGFVECGWTCDATWYGDGLCDCGCGAVDSDCGTEPVCTTPGTCDKLACDFCSDSNGNNVTCNNTWSCEATYLGDGECDCGCGAEDYDCEGLASCSEPDCYETACVWCWDDYGNGTMCN